MVFMINLLLGFLVGSIGVGLVVIAIDLFVKALGIERAGGTGDAGDHRKCNERGQGGLHDQSPIGFLVGSVGVGLVVVAIDLLVEALGIERAGGTGDAGDHRKRNERGRDGLHDQSPIGSWLARFEVGLVVVAIDLLVEALGIERAGGTGDAGDHRKRN